MDYFIVVVFPHWSSHWFMNFIVGWTIVLLGLMAIGGYFMFRKFLKVLPMNDGKSKLDWQCYWIEQSRELWTEQTKALLVKLVTPVPSPFRDIARHSIAAKIGQIACESGAIQITLEHCIQGYILATPKRDHRRVIKCLNKHGIDYTPYKRWLQL